MADYGFKDVFVRELRRMGGRPAYIVGMVLVPLFITFFFVSLLGPGLPDRIPTAVVDLDQSVMSRQIRRALGATQQLNLSHDAESYDNALDLVRRGEVFGFFVIPDHFEQKALSGRTPTLEYYSNMTFYIPGSLTFKGFKSVAVTTAGGLARNTLISLGADPEQVGDMLQPVVVDINGLGNPWMNYSVYLTPSFTMASLVLLIMIMTVTAVNGELKGATSIDWLNKAHGRITVALAGKLLPHTLVYLAVGSFMLWVYFVWQHFPLNGHLGWILLATFLLIIATQCLALTICAIVPDLRYAYSITALFGVLSYSFTGFSMPVASMYGAIGVFSWLAPVRYWFLIYIGDALNGYPIYYCRWYFVALTFFCLVPLLLLRRLKKNMLNPVYEP